METTTTLEQQSRVVKSVMINSFRFSRGDAWAQRAILSYVGHALRGTLEKAAFAAALDETAEACIKISNNTNKHVPLPPRPALSTEKKSSATYLEVRSFMADLQLGVLARNDFKPSAARVATSLIAADKRWLPELRHERSGAPDIGPYTSNLVHYGLLGHRTGSDVFNHMFAVAAGEGLQELFTNTRWQEFPGNPRDEVRKVFLGHAATHQEHEEMLGQRLAELVQQSELEPRA